MKFTHLTVDQVSANNIVVSQGNQSALYSYGTLIAVKDNSKVCLTKDWKYSPATSKHRAKFLNETTAVTRSKLQSGEYTLCS